MLNKGLNHRAFDISKLWIIYLILQNLHILLTTRGKKKILSIFLDPPKTTIPRAPHPFMFSIIEKSQRFLCRYQKELIQYCGVFGRYSSLVMSSTVDTFTFLVVRRIFHKHKLVQAPGWVDQAHQIPSFSSSDLKSGFRHIVHIKPNLQPVYFVSFSSFSLLIWSFWFWLLNILVIVKFSSIMKKF